MTVVKTPVSYKDFAKNPLTAMLFMAISGLSYFVYENKKDTLACKDEIKTMQVELKGAIEEIKTLRQDNGALRAELNTRKELNKF